MERKTQIHAEDGKQALTVTREFDLSLETLFRAYEEAELIEQWMGTHVLKLDTKPHGGYQFETRDAGGRVVFRANGVFHEFDPNRQIIRTFEMEHTPFDVQLEFLDFEKLSADHSRLTMHIVFRSIDLRDQMLKLPFAHGIHMAHERLQKIMSGRK